jgi:hypothetical protein
MSILKNLAPGVDMTLVMRSLTVSRSAVGVVGVYIVMVCPWTYHILAKNSAS